MDLEMFLELEKKQLAEDRERLYENIHESSLFTAIANTTACKSSDDKDVYQPNENSCITNKQFYNKDKIYGKKTKSLASDDMEQWVSDTFYSYFPGFTNEYRKRQNELQTRQRENQENLIKHQMLNKNRCRKIKNLTDDGINNSARSINSSLLSNCGNGSSVNKTEKQIINVNNPNYAPSRHSNQSVHPDSARYRLLQDLRHTNLTNFETHSHDDTMEINRRRAEIESTRKKKYQRELMQQIEEKRRAIKLLKNKEQQQEEILTRRLQEQLRTMKLEEQLEKERLEAVKVRFDMEQNRLNRENLLAKLEKDTQLISNTDLSATTTKKHIKENIKTNKENILNRQDNKIYKYFSNSEKHNFNYRNKSSSQIDLDLNETEISKIERECFHLSERICPMCDEPLKKLENFCLRCQNKLSFPIRPSLLKINTIIPLNSQKSKPNIDNSERNSSPNETASDRSFFLVCTRCERLYSWCKNCTSKKDICKACQNKRNLCMICRQTLCSFCLEEVACGKNTESFHINDTIESVEKKNVKDDSLIETSLQMDKDKEFTENEHTSGNFSILTAEYASSNNLAFLNSPTYSINITENTVSHPDKKQSPIFPTIEDKYINSLDMEEKNVNSYNKDYFPNKSSDDEKNIENLRCHTDKRLSKYLKNYGDLAYHTRSTQTTPTTTGRRDIVMQGEHSLCIPLLREMPKMTRVEAKNIKENSKEFEDLQRRWDVRFKVY